MKRLERSTRPFILAAALSLTACPEPPPNQGGETTGVGSTTDEGCTPGSQDCECSEGFCLGELECVDGICLDPECTPGSEGCPCADGALCLGELECEAGICLPPGEDGCSPMDYFRCSEGDVYWFDSCSNKGGLKKDCDPNTQNCVNTSDTEAYCVSNMGECGDGMIEPGEDCEGADLQGMSCQSLGYAGGELGCSMWCALDTSACESCGNDTVDDPSEDCDGTDLQEATCQSFNYEGGDLDCGSDCRFDFDACTSCSCGGGVCCQDGCDYDNPNLVCDDEAAVEYGCPDGSDPGEDVSLRSRVQYCSGMDATCEGDLGPWGGWEPGDNCDWDERCSPGDPTCNPCSFGFDVTQYECSTYSSANGGGGGGGQIIRVCASTNAQTGYMTVKARKMDGSSFGARPYQVRVSGDQDDPCGPNAWFFVVSDSDPVGIGTNELTFSFPPQWEPQQWEKAYCVTASTQPGDPGYDGNNPQQQSWWHSKKANTVRECN